MEYNQVSLRNDPYIREVVTTVGTLSGNEYVSKIEQDIINSINPLPLTESEEISVNGAVGLWANKNEIIGFPSIEQYRIHNDANPQIIRKKQTNIAKYIQEIAIKYLKPPEPSRHGDLIIRQEPDRQMRPAPPIIIRQAAARTPDLPTMVIREAPPKMPLPLPEKVINIPGKIIPPPKRKVIIEKLPAAPPKPQNILIERWLPVSEPKRRVIFEKAAPTPVVDQDPKNIIIEWEVAGVQIDKQYKNLGVFHAIPEEYKKEYNFTTQTDYVHKVPELEGDVHALKLIDLDAHGLSEYRSLLTTYTTAPISSTYITTPGYTTITNTTITHRDEHL